MTLEECLKKDGTYILLECKNHYPEFELVVKDGEHVIYSIEYSPFTKRMLNEKKDISLMCDLHEDTGWEREENVE